MPRLLDAVEGEMTAIRHDLHAHPELSFEERRTTAVITERLRALGWEVRRCPTSTGAVARLTGGAPGRRVMLRADIDALPVDEEVDVPFASTVPGVMHACGHDVHAASLLGVADILSRCRDDVAGEFTLIFQPAEEVIGGARAMIDGGLLDDNPADVVLGAHVTSLAPVGFVGTRAGVLMSHGTTLSVHLTGKGGHGALSTVEGNVVLAISHLAPRLSEVVDGLEYEGTRCACSAGVLTAGTKNNVVPRDAVLRGTLRTFTDEEYHEAVKRLHALLDEVSALFTVRCVLEVNESTPAVTNDPLVTERVLATATSLFGADYVLTFPPVTPSDDVSELLNRVPGCYLFVGGALDDGTSGMHHGPDFSIDDRALRVQAAVLAASAVDLAAG
jgi:amidohydrolase